jgi:hypothetical protein
VLEWPLPENCYASFGLQSTHSPLNEVARCLNVGSPRNTGRSTELSPLAALAELQPLSDSYGQPEKIAKIEIAGWA